MGFEWHYMQDGHRYGPVGDEVLRQLAHSGRLRPTDVVWRAGFSGWVPASAVEGLLPVPVAVPAIPQTKPPPPPQNTAPVAPPHPREFQDLYNQISQFSIPIAVLSVVGVEATTETGMIKETVRLLGALVLFLILSSMFLYKAWALIQDGRARTTPREAVGLRFVPFFAFYWEFVAVKGLAEDLDTYARSREIPIGPIATGIAHWSCVFLVLSGLLSWVPVLGGLLHLTWFVLFLMSINSLKSACMAIAEAKLRREPTAAAVMDAGAIVEVVSSVVETVEKGVELLQAEGRAAAEQEVAAKA
jgi:hypothetical protein